MTKFGIAIGLITLLVVVIASFCMARKKRREYHKRQALRRKRRQEEQELLTNGNHRHMSSPLSRAHDAQQVRAGEAGTGGGAKPGGATQLMSLTQNPITVETGVQTDFEPYFTLNNSSSSSSHNYTAFHPRHLSSSESPFRSSALPQQNSAPENISALVAAVSPYPTHSQCPLNGSAANQPYPPLSSFKSVTVAQLTPHSESMPLSADTPSSGGLDDPETASRPQANETFDHFKMAAVNSATSGQLTAEVAAEKQPYSQQSSPNQSQTSRTESATLGLEPEEYTRTLCSPLPAHAHPGLTDPGSAGNCGLVDEIDALSDYDNDVASDLEVNVESDAHLDTSSDEGSQLLEGQGHLKVTTSDAASDTDSSVGEEEREIFENLKIKNKPNITDATPPHVVNNSATAPISGNAPNDILPTFDPFETDHLLDEPSSGEYCAFNPYATDVGSGYFGNFGAPPPFDSKQSYSKRTDYSKPQQQQPQRRPDECFTAQLVLHSEPDETPV